MTPVKVIKPAVTATPISHGIIFGVADFDLHTTQEWNTLLATKGTGSVQTVDTERLAAEVMAANEFGQTRDFLEKVTTVAVAQLREKLPVLFGEAFIGVDTVCATVPDSSRTVMVARVRVREATDADWWAANYDAFTEIVGGARRAAGPTHLQVDLQFDR